MVYQISDKSSFILPKIKSNLLFQFLDGALMRVPITTTLYGMVVLLALLAVSLSSKDNNL
jgi:hypothetical protein